MASNLGTVPYWREHIKASIWHPLDTADRILLLVGAIAGYLRAGESAIMLDLAWQIPLGIFLVFLIWRLMGIPPKMIRQIREERGGRTPVTLEGLSEQVSQFPAMRDEVRQLTNATQSIKAGVGNIVSDVDAIKEKINPAPLTSVPWDVLLNIITEFQHVFWEPGGIARVMRIVFRIRNQSQFRIKPTSHVTGWLSIEGHLLVGMPWDMMIQPPMEIQPGDHATMYVRVAMSDRLAETLAFKAKIGDVSLDMSDMYFEVAAGNGASTQILGLKQVSSKMASVPITDQEEFKHIRAFVEWRESLGQSV